MAENMRVVIREPWLKESRDGYFIRVDSPSDIILWPPHFASYRPHFQIIHSIEHFRQFGNTHFVAKRYYEALHAFEEGIYHHIANRKDVSLLRLNAAAAYLNIGSPGIAFRHLRESDFDHFTDAQKQKASYRTALALYQLERFDEAMMILEEQDFRSEATTAPEELRQRTQARLQEAQTGEYDWRSLYGDCLKGVALDLAEYCGAVSVAMVSGKGRGLLTTCDVTAGELLLVSRPIEVSRPDPSRKNLVLGLNISSESLDTYTQVDLPGLLMQHARDDARVNGQLDALYAGPSFPDPLNPLDLQGGNTENPWNMVLDSGRLEGICTYNSFRPQCITQGSDLGTSGATSDPSSDHLHTASALYFLPSMMNHTCIGNAAYTFFNDVFVLRATESIASGQEVLDS